MVDKRGERAEPPGPQPLFEQLAIAQFRHGSRDGVHAASANPNRSAVARGEDLLCILAHLWDDADRVLVLVQYSSPEARIKRVGSREPDVPPHSRSVAAPNVDEGGTGRAPAALAVAS